VHFSLFLTFLMHLTYLKVAVKISNFVCESPRITVFVDFVHRSEFQITRKQRFRFQGGEEDTYSLWVP
jgi:hypothetical protein